MIDRYYERDEDAGRFARRVQREMAARWVSLLEHGVEPTNTRTQRALSFAVMWRKGSNGTASLKGNQRAERSVSRVRLF